MVNARGEMVHRRGANRANFPTVLTALALVGPAIGCATIENREPPRTVQEVDSAYDRLFPYYVELCAVSQIRARFTDHGGSPGHAAMYLKGACRDDATSYPTLKICGPEVDLDDPSSGTGINVTLPSMNPQVGPQASRKYTYSPPDRGKLIPNSE